MDFALEPGDFVCLSGLNGCGKSTLLSVLAGVVLADLTYTGQVLVDGKPIKKIPKKEVARQIGFLSQKEYSVWNFSVLETIVTGRYCYTGLSGTYSEQDYHIAREAAALLQIENLLDRKIHTGTNCQNLCSRTSNCTFRRTGFRLGFYSAVRFITDS